MGLREIKMERTRQLIADTAFDLFVQQGFEPTTIEQIAAAAEVGPRTLYRYYPTKESLLVGFVRNALREALEGFRAQPEDVPLPEALYAVVEGVLRTIGEDTDRVRAVYSLAYGTPSVRAQLVDHMWEWRAALAVEIGRRLGGRSPELAAALAAANTLNVIDVTVKAWVASGGRTSMRRLIHRALDLLRSGQVPVPTPPSRT